MPVERSYPPRVLRRALLALVVSHAVVSLVLAPLLFDDPWSDDPWAVMQWTVGGGLWLFLFLAGPVVAMTFIVWAVIAWYASGARRLSAGWVTALAIGWLGVLPVAVGSGSMEPVGLVAAGCGQVGAWLFGRFVFRTSLTDAAAASP